MIKFFIGLPVLFFLFFIKINFSGSMPIGVYLKQYHQSLERGDTVAVCLPIMIAREGKRQGYLANGFCPSFSMPVLKMLIAKPQDEVVIGEDTITVNQQVYFAPRQPNIKQVDFKQHQNPTHHYWLYGQYNPQHSWDSRYFGGVEKSNIRGVYKPLLVWKTHSKGDE